VVRTGSCAALGRAVQIAVGLQWGWVGRLGFLADLLSKSVLVGHMAGMAALMVASQFGKLTGISVDEDSFVTEVAFVASHLGEVHRPTLALSAGVLVFPFVGSRQFPRSLPVPPIGMLLAAARSRSSTSRPGGSPSLATFRRGYRAHRFPTSRPPTSRRFCCPQSEWR